MERSSGGLDIPPTPVPRPCQASFFASLAAPGRFLVDFFGCQTSRFCSKGFRTPKIERAHLPGTSRGAPEYRFGSIFDDFLGRAGLLVFIVFDAGFGYVFGRIFGLVRLATAFLCF